MAKTLEDWFKEIPLTKLKAESEAFMLSMDVHVSEREDMAKGLYMPRVRKKALILKTVSMNSSINHYLCFGNS